MVDNGCRSNENYVTSGVPQWSVLGPLLFLLYINDKRHELSSTIRLFADDRALYRRIDSMADALVLQQDLGRLQKWANTWQTSFNVKKCKTLRITRRTKNKIVYSYKMNTNLSTETLEEITSDKYLGIILDSKLNFNTYVDEIIEKATNLLNLCRRNLSMCSKEVKETASSWSPHTKRNICKIEAVQRRAARFVLRDYRYGPEVGLTKQIENALKWPTIETRRKIHDLQLFYKIRNNLFIIHFPPVVRPSYHYPSYYTHIQSLH